MTSVSTCDTLVSWGKDSQRKDFMETKDFELSDVAYGITMLTQTNKKLYLMASGDSYSWSFAPSDAIWFQTADQATKFAKKYFTNFNDWNVEQVARY